MSFVNDIRIIGELVEDATVSSGANAFALMKIKTGRPFKGNDGKTKWEFQTHTVKCFKSEAFNMIKSHAKKGKWMKVLGELSYGKNGSTEVLVRKTTGDIGMMFAHLSNDDVNDHEHAADENPYKDTRPSQGLISSTFNSSRDIDDEIPF